MGWYNEKYKGFGIKHQQIVRKWTYTSRTLTETIMNISKLNGHNYEHINIFGIGFWCSLCVKSDICHLDTKVMSLSSALYLYTDFNEW